jgi:hypothetical protein
MQEALKHHWRNCLQDPGNRDVAIKLNEDLLKLKTSTTEGQAQILLQNSGHRFDNFKSQFGQLVYKLIVTFMEGSVEKFSAEFQNLKLFNWDQMGASLIVWQQLNILQNPLANFNIDYQYESEFKFETPPGPIKKYSNDELARMRVEFNKNAKSRKAEMDMLPSTLIAKRSEKVFNTFMTNEENFFINCHRRYYDKYRDDTEKSRERYEKSHDILLAATKGLKKNWTLFFEKQTAKKFSFQQREEIDKLFWEKSTPNIVSTKILSNSHLDHAVALFNYFLGLSASFNWPHRQLMHLAPRDIYTSLKTRGVLVNVIKRSLDWAQCNSVILPKGGLSELPLTTIHQMANESCEGGGKSGDLQFVENLVMNRNVTNAHLINHSNGRLINNDIFNKKKMAFSTDNIPRNFDN